MQKELYKIDLGAVRLSVRTHNASFGQNITSKNVEEAELLYQVHTHSSYELFAVVGGEITIVTEKETYSCRDSIIIVPRNFRHYAVFGSASVVILNFIPQAIDNSVESLYNDVVSHISNEIFICPISENERFYSERLLEKENRVTFAEVEGNLLSLLFAEIFSRFTPREAVPIAQPKNQNVTVIDTYIALNSNRRICLEDLAKELHLCTKQVSRIIKKEHGCTLAELVVRHRIGIAQMLLAKTDMKTYEISESVGYESPKDFRMNFKKVCGMTPTEYRKQMTRTN